MQHMKIVDGELDDPRVQKLLAHHFAAARAFYARHGFVDCPAFGDYIADPNSVFMTLRLDKGP